MPHSPELAMLLPVEFLMLSTNSPVSGLERVDHAVAEVADQHVIAERAEVGRRERHAPWSIEPPADGHQVLQQRALRVERVHEAEPGAVRIVVGAGTRCA